MVTSQRAVFTGQKHSREWSWSKLLGVTHYEPGWTAMAVSNRQKVSGVAVGPEHHDAVDFWIDLAVAHANDTVTDVVDDCLDDVEQLTAALAALDTPSAPSAPEALPPTD